MSIEWTGLGEYRHVTTAGKAICDATGEPSMEPLLPCEKCLLLLFALQSEAFIDELAEVK